MMAYFNQERLQARDELWAKPGRMDWTYWNGGRIASLGMFPAPLWEAAREFFLSPLLNPLPVLTPREWVGVRNKSRPRDRIDGLGLPLTSPGDTGDWPKPGGRMDMRQPLPSRIRLCSLSFALCSASANHIIIISSALQVPHLQAPPPKENESPRGNTLRDWLHFSLKWVLSL